MSKLEDRIIKKVYKEETKKTFLGVFSQVTLILMMAIIGFGLTQLLLAYYAEQKTLDVLEIFNEDFDIIKKYIGDVLETLYRETPKDILIGLILVVTVFLIVTLTFIKNFGKIRNKIRSIFKFWFK